jgi:hypothetical protein
VKEIDDRAIAIILRALENGVRLNDPTYEFMLEETPHFKRIRDRKEE